MAPRVLNGNHNGAVSENVVLGHIKVFDELNRQAAAIKGKQTQQWKLAKDDGIKKAELEQIMKERNELAADRNAREERLNLFRKYLRFPEAMNQPARPEFKDEVGLSDEERTKKWEDEGYVAGKTGKGRDECYHEDPNSLGARHWMLGYDKGQAELAPKKMSTSDPNHPKNQAKAKAEAEKAKPQPEPVVVEAGKKKAAGKGITYWHSESQKKAYERTIADADLKETVPDIVAITRPEYEKLKAKYEAEEKAAWDAAEKVKADQPAGGDADDFGDDDNEAPPAPTMN